MGSEEDFGRNALLEELGLATVPSKDELLQQIEERFLTPKRVLRDDLLRRWAIDFPRSSKPAAPEIQLNPLPHTHEPAFIRKGLEGRIVGYKEVLAPPPPSNALNSLSLSRAPNNQSSFVRGQSSNLPFLPGGLDREEIANPQALKSRVTEVDDEEDEEDPDDVLQANGGWKSIPPGFRTGVSLGSVGDDGHEEEDDWLLNYFVSVGKEDQSDERANEKGIKRLVQSIGPSIVPKSSMVPTVNSEVIPGLDDLLPTSSLTLARGDTSAAAVAARKAKAKKLRLEKREWAHVVETGRELLNFHELVPDMAHKYPFELDTFQKEAVYHLEMGDSVFVAAHTSAGKTVVAEYAIALAAKHMTRAIYTSPIKALSNQKFRDFKQTFDPSTIGILTGDVQINPEGSCLIMTTEILRSMLYKGADLIRDVEFVIFDEVHYVNDAERGVVWEEVIILLPEHVNIILLSATVPNTKEFAGWVGRTKKKDIYVINTAKRPVPLEHFLWAGKALHKILDASGSFLGDGLKDAGEALRRKQEKEREAAGLPPLTRTGGRGLPPARGNRGAALGRGAPAGRGGAGGGRGGAMVPRGNGMAVGRGGRGGGAPAFHRTGGPPDKNLWVHLVNHLKTKNLLPVVIFVFSKKRCEDYASSLSNTDLCNASEKSQVHVTIERAIKRLKGSDKKLPQIQRMRDLLSRGIGVHHGGLLPLVKEVVEILFAQGLVKVLFATETFAMGVNMPARSVVFSGIRKHDGKSFRELLPGEYTQMSGRAGRRGLDATGVVIIVCNDEVPETQILHQMMLGQPNKLSSQFRLTYNMILNLLRVEALRVEEMIKRSFSENASQSLLPDQQQKVLAAEKSLAELPKLECNVCKPDISSFYDLSAELVYLNTRLMEIASSHPMGLKSLSTGRVVVLRDEHFQMNLALILRPDTLLTAGATEQHRSYLVLALVDEETKSGQLDREPGSLPPIWPPTHKNLRLPTEPLYDLRIIPVTSISLVTSRTHKLDSDTFKAIANQHRKSHMNKAVSALLTIGQNLVKNKNVQEVDWSKLRALEFQEGLRSRLGLAQRVKKKACVLCANFDEHYDVIHKEKSLQGDIAQLKMAISDQNLELLPDYESRIEVLKELRFIDDNSTVLLKGRVACEINSADELILTELILDNALASYEPEEVVALLSCFVFQEKSEGEPVIPENLVEGKNTIVTLADKIGRVQDRFSVPHEDAATKLKFGLVEVVYEWAKGMPFEQITSITDVAEGTIVRCITRLDETCREVRDAARVIGDADLFKKMEDAQTMIKRDIVFAASLYF